MPETRWRLLDTGPRPAAGNIAIDEALLECGMRSSDCGVGTLRFLQFNPPAVLVGYHQCVEEEVRVDFCRRESIAIGRRLTGGGAIYLDRPQLGWEIAAPSRLLPPDSDALYALLCRGAVAGLRKLGVRARFRPKNDIEVGGRKISGTGATRSGGAVLFQGTLLTDFDVETMLRALRIPTEKLRDREVESVRERVTSLKGELGVLPPLRRVKAALAEGFGEVLGAGFVEGRMTREEAAHAARRTAYFASKRWVFSTRAAPGGRRVLRSALKTPGGLVRFQFVVDAPAKRINYALITGDFFASPKDAIPGLEAALKGAPADAREVARRLRGFFRSGKVEVPGVKVRDFVEAAALALSKLRYVSAGLPLAGVNHIFTVGLPIEEARGYDVLLLPYCAKLPSCAYRNREECARCGECSVGTAYALADRLGIRAITITNYEHLRRTLSSLKGSGARGFIGCCCEPFYIKHRRDFEEAGLPGVLVDIDDTTCYDLGRVREAKAGKWNEFTSLKMKLLRRVVAKCGVQSKK